MEDKSLVGLGMNKSVGNKIIRKIKLNRDNFSGEDCNEYFNLRSNDLRNRMNEIFPGQYKFKNLGNEHIFETMGDSYSVHYMIDNNGLFKVTETIPKYSLINKIENDC